MDRLKEREIQIQLCKCKNIEQHRNYRLIFMDCNMPIMDGFQATSEIRKTYSKEEIHIAALTAYAQESFKQKCEMTGMNTFLTKPVNEEKLSNLLSELNLIKYSNNNNYLY